MLKCYLDVIIQTCLPTCLYMVSGFALSMWLSIIFLLLRELMITAIVSFGFQIAGLPFSLIGSGSTVSGLPVSSLIPLPQRPPSSLNERKPSVTLSNCMKPAQSSSVQPVIAPLNGTPTLPKASNRVFVYFDVVHLISFLFVPCFFCILSANILKPTMQSRSGALLSIQSASSSFSRSSISTSASKLSLLAVLLFSLCAYVLH